MMHLRLTNMLARLLGITFLAGAVLVVGLSKPAAAQGPSGQKPPAVAAATSTKPQTVEQRITLLKKTLKIAPDQEPRWEAVAQAMRDNANRMERLVAGKRAVPADKTTAVDDLMTYQEIAEAQLEGLRNLTSAFRALYETMTPEQKKNADQAFKEYASPRPGLGSQG